MNVFEILDKGVQLDASDIHIICDCRVVAKVGVNFVHLTKDVLDANQTKEMAMMLAGNDLFIKIARFGEYDFSLDMQNGCRFRINIYKQKDSYAIAIRIIKNQILPFEELGLPEIASKFTSLQKGLVMVTGPTGSGKSTTLASLIDIINKNYQKHIITLEDPIEYVHNHKKSIISQREIGNDTKSFDVALKSVLRQNPDVILIGEMRDQKTTEIALRAAETGHLVFATLHTTGAAKTIDRILDMFDGSKQAQIKAQLASVCEGIISQQLIPSVDNKHKVLAAEIMVCTSGIKNLIRESKVHQIPNMIQTGASFGMQSMDNQLIKLYKERKISKECLLDYCIDCDYINKNITFSHHSLLLI